MNEVPFYRQIGAYSSNVECIFSISKTSEKKLFIFSLRFATVMLFVVVVAVISPAQIFLSLFPILRAAQNELNHFSKQHEM